ncbi:MAG: hypothetical protein ACLFUS_04535 [Candidatus Sumerlaeia bacterium]
MQENLLIFWQKIEAHLRPLVFLILAGMLAYVIYLRYSERPEPAPQGFGGGSKEELDQNREAAQKVRQNLYPDAPPMEGSAYGSLVADNMFAVKTAQEVAEKEAQANELYQEAQTLYNNEEYEESLRKVNEALAFSPSFLDAVTLKKQLQEKLEQEEPSE